MYGRGTDRQGKKHKSQKPSQAHNTHGNLERFGAVFTNWNDNRPSGKDAVGG